MDIDDTNQLLEIINSEIDALPFKFEDIVDVVKQNFESSCKIHHDRTKAELNALNTQIEKEKDDLHDTSEINRLSTNMNNLYKDLAFKTADFHKSIEELKVLNERTKCMEEENDELRKRMGALARRNKRKGQVLNSENSSTTSKTNRFPQYRRGIPVKQKHVKAFQNISLSDDRLESSLSGACIETENRDIEDIVELAYNIPSEPSPETNHSEDEARSSDQALCPLDGKSQDTSACMYELGGEDSTVSTLHRALCAVSARVEKRLETLPGNNSLLRECDISGYNTHAFTHADSYEAMIRFLSEPKRFIQVVHQLQHEFKDVNASRK